ncbi:MAG: glycosyltransferase family 4 protein [Bacteroidales bacterium]|nr:glycosyltransferase family 4 protein [Bacteroidales bacterium]
MIYFDCEQLRIPCSGFHSFCDQLASALAAEAHARGVDLGLYLPEDRIGDFGPAVRYKAFRHWHKYYLPLEKDVSLWHCARQRSRYMPSGRRVRVLTTIHDLNYLHVDASDKRKQYLRHRWQRSVDASDRIAVISEYTRKDLLDNLELRGKAVDVVYNGFERYDGLVTDPDPLPSRPFLLTLSRVVPSKNQRCLPALLRGNEYELYIVGPDGDKSCCEDILDEARRWGVLDRVHLTGAVGESEKQWYLRHCSAFLFPSLTEGFGLPVLEAMQYYKPVFCSSRTSLPEVGGSVAFYFNEAFDPGGMQEEFRRGMDAFASGQVSREQVEEHLSRFTWENAAKQYFDIYSSMLSV